MAKNYPYEVFKKTLIERYGYRDDSQPRIRGANDYYSIEENINYWCISDGFIMVMIPHYLIGAAGKSDIEILNIIPTHRSEPVLCTVNEFKQALDKCDSEPGYNEQFEECAKCSGYGFVNDKDSDFDGDTCEYCEGEGEVLVNKIPTGLIAYPTHGTDDYQQIIKLIEAHFYPQILNRMVQCIELLQFQDCIIQVISQKASGATFIVVGEIKFLIMPVAINDYIGVNVKATIPQEAAKV